MKITRRQFFQLGFIGTCLIVLARFFKIGTSWNKQSGISPFRNTPSPIPGSIIGASSALGHRLRELRLRDSNHATNTQAKNTTSENHSPLSENLPKRIIKKDVVIVGAGISGIAAGYRLAKEGVHDFLILDLEKVPGGNSSFRENAISAYPLGAHYVSLITEEAAVIKKVFEELGVITGYNKQGLPIYNDYYLCSDPQERLFINGRWQEGLIPKFGVSDKDRQQYQKFFSQMQSLKDLRGADNKKVFSIPVDKSSQDEQWTALDKITMEQWLTENNYSSVPLRWYVEYCCRDDFGTTLAETSAWAGLHYFASRNGLAANADPSNVLTWPEGNGWLVKQLSKTFQKNILTNSLVYKVQQDGDSVLIDYLDASTNETIRIIAKAVILATPHFVTKRILAPKHSETINLQATASPPEISYSPWVVFNITLDTLPIGRGTRLSWDNVVYNSKFLGYVVATHQLTQSNPRKTVITYYLPLTHLDPNAARLEAQNRTYEEWQKILLEELLKIHPELTSAIKQIDVWIWGHGMVRPTPGVIWGETRKQMLKQTPPIFTAHSDMSGISIFEEAFIYGIRAGENTLAHLNLSYHSML